MRYFYRQSLFTLGLFVALNGATTGCGTAGSEGEAIATETAALVSLPTPYLHVCGGAGYSSRVSMLLAPNDEVCLRWDNFEKTSPMANTTGSLDFNACPSGACEYTLRRRANGQVTVVADHIRPGSEARSIEFSPPLRLAGGSRLEYWVVVNDVADPTVTSPPSNTIVVSPCGYLHSNEYLFADHPIYSCTADYRLYPQADGNLVFSQYKSTTGDYTTAIWSTGPKSGANRLYMQADGNLVYSAQPADVAKWTTRTNSTSSRNNSGAELVMTSNRFEVRKNTTTLWRSDTGRTY